MGRKANPNSKFRWKSNAPRCPVCGGGTRRGIHKKCEGQPHYARLRREQEESLRKQAAEDRERIDRENAFWNDPENASAVALIMQRYGGRPENLEDCIKNWWK